MRRNFFPLTLGLLGASLFTLCHCHSKPDAQKTKITLAQLFRENKDFRLIPDSSSVKRILLDSLIELKDSFNVKQPGYAIRLTEDQVTRAAAMINSAWKNKLLEIGALRKKIAAEQLSFSVAITSKSFLPLARLMGDRDPTAKDLAFLANWKSRIKNLEADIAPNLRLNGTQLDPASAVLDLRTFGLISPPKDQDTASTCWAFSATAAYEAAYKLLKGKDINASEQEVINCSGAGNAIDGGMSFLVFRWMVDSTRNLDDNAAEPYLAINHSCSLVHPNTDYFAVAANLVSLDNNINTVPSVAWIKNAICKHGAISAAVYATDRWINYTGGVLDDKNSYLDQDKTRLSNHAILIIGWSDPLKSWLVKNSWGTNWGSTCKETGYNGKDRGFIWVHYGCENIGKKACWVTPKQ